VGSGKVSGTNQSMNTPEPAPEIQLTPSQEGFFRSNLDRFFQLFPEVDADAFWERNPQDRFRVIKDVFSLYAEMFGVPSVKAVDAEYEGGKKPPQQTACRLLLRVVRNLFAHFPQFDSWDSFTFCHSMVTWDAKGENGMIARFFKTPPFQPATKFRIWHPELKKFSYLTVSIPTDYLTDRMIPLREILPEKEGVQFSIRMMADVLIEAARKAGL
jgi:hypothetical protein